MTKQKATIGKPKVFAKPTYEKAATADIFYFHHEGSVLAVGQGAELRLTIPAGNYEIEGSALLYNHNADKKIYAGFLFFFLDDNEISAWEGGQLGSTDDSRPYKLNMKAYTTFNTSKTIRFIIGSSATVAFQAENPSLVARRVGLISYRTD